MIWWIINFPFPFFSFFFLYAAEFLASISRHEESCAARLKAAELSPNDYQLVTSLATALRQLDRKHDAEKWYLQVSFNILAQSPYEYWCSIVLYQAVNLRPNDPRAWTNLGAIQHLLGKTHQATLSYKTALNLQPEDPTTLSNLKKLQGGSENSWEPNDNTT